MFGSSNNSALTKKVTGKITFSDPGDPDDGVAFISSNIEGGGANPGGNLNFFTSTDGGGSDNSVALRMTISGSGNVGIGTDSPGTKLVIGSSGQIGVELIEQLSKIHGHNNVIGSDIKPLLKNKVNGVKYLSLDVLDKTALLEVVKKYNINHE